MIRKNEVRVRIFDGKSTGSISRRLEFKDQMESENRLTISSLLPQKRRLETTIAEMHVKQTKLFDNK